MFAVGTVLKEHIKNFYLIQRLAQFQIKITNHNNYLGIAWEVLNPALQIMVYWLVFGLGIRSNAPIHGIPFVFWLLVGGCKSNVLQETCSLGLCSKWGSAAPGDIRYQGVKKPQKKRDTSPWSISFIHRSEENIFFNLSKHGYVIE
mgnify:CR=1 FL=1